MKEKKEKVEEKAVHKEKKKEVVEVRAGAGHGAGSPGSLRAWNAKGAWAMQEERVKEGGVNEEPAGG